MRKKIAIDYIDVDVAYLLGFIVARGKLSEEQRIKQIIIEFPFKNLEVEGITRRVVQRDQILLSLREATKRVNELVDAQIRQEENAHTVYLIIETMKNSMFWRNIKTLLRGKTTYYEFSIPEEIFESSEDVKREFLRGYADVAGSARASNIDWGGKEKGRHRVYLDVLNLNWTLPIELCHLIQDHLEVPVNTIAYGHPNIRDPRCIEYNKGRIDAWAREHQIKIFADEFEKIGFYMTHKQEVLKELADYNKERGFGKAKFCNPPKKIRTPKLPHPGENSEKLPKELRGKHFDSYWQICAILGCLRYSEYLKTQARLSKFSEQNGEV